MTTPPLTHLDGDLALECPRCQASPGASCVDRRGKPCRPHSARSARGRRKAATHGLLERDFGWVEEHVPDLPSWVAVVALQLLRVTYGQEGVTPELVRARCERTHPEQVAFHRRTLAKAVDEDIAYEQAFRALDREEPE